MNLRQVKKAFGAVLKNGESTEKELFHVAPRNYKSGDDILSAYDLQKQTGKFKNKWKNDWEDYHLSEDYHNVSLFDDINKAHDFNNDFLNNRGKVLTVRVPEDFANEVGRNHEGYHIIRRVPNDWIVKSVAGLGLGASLYSPEAAQAKQYRDMAENQALEGSALDPSEMIAAAATGGGSLTARAARALLEPAFSWAASKLGADNAEAYEGNPMMFGNKPTGENYEW